MRKVALIISIVCSIAVQAQHITKQNYAFADETQLWRLTGNAAGLSLDSAQARGVAIVDYSHRSGDFHRVQEGSQTNNLELFTERYQQIGKYLYGYGSFKFDMGRTKNRAWSDVIRTYESNPFISGSSVEGSYDHQDFELNASIATVPMGRFTYGANLNYKVGDLSRLRDPRSRINLAQYRLTPAITYSIGSSTLGLAGYYDRRKEKLPNLTTVQTDPNLMYYQMTGIATASGTIGGYNGYMREYVAHTFGGEVNYGYRSEHFNSVNALSMSHTNEYIYGTNKYQPGRYFANTFGFATHNRLKTGSTLQSVDATLKYEEAYADEYRQERISETDSITGYNSIYWRTLMTYKKRHQMKKYEAALRYRCSFVDNDAINGYIGMQAKWRSVDLKHLLPEDALKYGNTLVQLEGGLPLLQQRLWIEAQAGYSFAKTVTLNTTETTYATNVLIPDALNILDKDYFTGSMKCSLQLPVTIDNKTRNWVLSLYGNYISAKNDLNRYHLGISLGLYY